MNEWTRMEKAKIARFENDYNPDYYSLYEYGKQRVQFTCETVDEMYDWMEKNGRSIRSWRGRLSSWGRWYCKVRLMPIEGEKERKRFVKNILSEQEAIERIENMAAKHPKWMSTIPQWIFNNINKNLKIYVCGTKWGGLTFKSRPQEYKEESNLTDIVLDKILDVVSKIQEVAA